MFVELQCSTGTTHIDANEVSIIKPVVIKRSGIPAVMVMCKNGDKNFVYNNTPVKEVIRIVEEAKGYHKFG